MPVNWYIFNVTGSLTNANTYVRRYTEESERSGIVPVPPETSAISSATSIQQRRRRSSQKKSPRTSKVVKIAPEETNSGTKSEPAVVRDSPKMIEFFAEVRQRELRDYYLRMKAAERSSRAPAVCPNCRLPRHAAKHISENIYCSGAQSMRQEVKNRSKNKDRDRYRDLTWLWNSSVACPHPALSCG